MSEDVTSQGFFGVLVNPISGQEERDALIESLYDLDVGLGLNYEGTLVFSENKNPNYYGLTLCSHDEIEKTAFFKLCLENCLDVDSTTITHYVCTWYNGSDSDMSLLTANEYMEKIS